MYPSFAFLQTYNLSEVGAFTKPMEFGKFWKGSPIKAQVTNLR